MADRSLRIRMLLEAGNRMTRPLRDAAAGSSRLATALRATRDRLKEVDRAQADIGSFRQLKAGLGDAERAMLAARTRATQLGREIAQTEAPSKRLRAEFERAKREASNLTTAHSQQAAQLQEVRARLTAAGISTRNLADAERRLRTEAGQTNDQLREQERRLVQVTDRARRFTAARERFSGVQNTATGLAAGGAASVGVGMAVGAPVVAASRAAMTLEEGMAGVAKVTNMAAPQLARMSGDILDMSERIPMAASGLAEIAAAAGSAGIGMDKMGKPMRDQREQLLAFTNDAAEMGIAFDMAAEDAGSTMAKWRTAFELPQAGVRALGDQVNALTNTFGGKAANVSDILTRIGPLGKVAGLAAPQIAALGSTLDSIGVPSEVAATGIKNTMLALTKGEAATKSQIGAFKALGLSATDVSKRMQKDAAGAIVDVMQRISNLNPEQQSGILTQLFGSESVAAIAPMLTNLDGLKARLGLVGDQSRYAGSMHGEFLARIATTQGATGLAANGLQALNIQMGTALLPTIKAGAERVLAITGGIRKWAAAHPGITRAAGVATGVLAALFLVLGGGAIVIAGLVAPFAALAGAATLLGIGMLPLIGIAAGIVLGIGLLAAGVYMLYANWGSVVQWFSDLWASVKALFFGALDAIISGFFRFHPLGLLITAIAPAIAYLRGLNFAEIGRNLIMGLIRGITNMLGALKNTIVNAASSAARWFKEKLGIHSPSRVFHQFGGFMMDGLEGGIGAGERKPVERIKDLSGDIIRALAVGASVPAIAATSAAATSARPAMAAPMGPISITIQQLPGQDSKELARLVAEQIEAIERRKAAAARSSFGDDQDYGAFS